MGPWDFDEAVAASENGGRAQNDATEDTKTAYREYAQADKLFRVALARKMFDLRKEGHAITACETLARGDEEIAGLKEDATIKEGLKEAAKQAAWKTHSDRKDTEALIQWARQRDLAEGFGPQPSWTGGRS